MLAGPIEATAIGNLLVQAVTCGTLGSVAEGRRAIAATATLAPRRFDPQNAREWKDAASRYREIELASVAGERFRSVQTPGPPTRHSRL